MLNPKKENSHSALLVGWRWWLQNATFAQHADDQRRRAQRNAYPNRGEYFVDGVRDHERSGTGAGLAGQGRVAPPEALQQRDHVYSAEIREKRQGEFKIKLRFIVTHIGVVPIFSS